MLSGPSGVGKNTIIQELLKRHKNLRYMKSATTRARREGEDNYLYLSKEEFLKKRESGDFFETQEVHGDFYGTLKDVIENCKNENYLKDIDVCGAKEIKKYLKDYAIGIFLEAPDHMLYKRLIDRGESEERARVRLSRAEMERKHKHGYDFVTDNIDIKQTVCDIEKFLESKNVKI